MINIRIVSSSSCLDFLGDYEIKSIEVKNGDELNGDLIIVIVIENEEYELRVSMKEGKKEGIGLIVREDGTLFMQMMFVNDECEGEVMKKNKYGSVVLKGRVLKGVEVGLWIEYDDNGNEIWRGLYRNGKRYSTLKEHEGMKGFYSELNMNGDLLSVSEYDENWMKNGSSFEYEEGVLKRECVYENGMKKRVLREWNENGMIEYDENRIRVYEGGFVRDMKNGFVREGEGNEFNSQGEVIRIGRWIKGYHEDSVKQFEDGYGNDLNEFDIDCLKGIERLMFGGDCLKNVNQFVIDGLNELKSVFIGKESFYLDKNNRIGSSCVIMNCDQLSEIHFGYLSFFEYESFELKNLPSLISIQLDDFAFYWCHRVVFDNLIRLQSINLDFEALDGDDDSVESNDLIMKNLPSLTSFKGNSVFTNIGIVILENIQSLTQQGIQMRGAFVNVKDLTSSNADSLEYIITLYSSVVASEHLLSLHPSVLWISRIDQMQQISKSVEHIVIQGCVGREEKQTSFTLSNLVSLITLELGCNAFNKCHVIVLDNLIRLQSITLDSEALIGDKDTVFRNELIMKNLPSLTSFNGFFAHFRNVGKVILENIPSLTQQGIQLEYSFDNVVELTSSNADSLDQFIRQMSDYLLTMDEYYFNSTTKRFECGYGNDLNEFDIDCLKGIERLMIGGDCFSKVNQFVIDGLNELKSVFIGKGSFSLDENNSEGSSCVIMNCDQLSEIHFGNGSFFGYESFELKNLPSLISIQLDDFAFSMCHVIVLDNLIRLQSITLGSFALDGDEGSVELNDLIMKNLPSLTSFKGYGDNFNEKGKVILENIPSLTQQGIQMGENAFDNVVELTSSNADSLDQFIRQSSLLSSDDSREQSIEETNTSCCSIL